MRSNIVFFPEKEALKRYLQKFKLWNDQRSKGKCQKI